MSLLILALVLSRVPEADASPVRARVLGADEADPRLHRLGARSSDLLCRRNIHARRTS